MESLEDFAERFRADVVKKCGCPVYKKALTTRFNLHNPHGVFAYIRRQPKLGCFRITAWKKHAEAAGVAHLACKPTTMWPEPGLVWYVKESDAESYAKAVDALSKICQVR